MTKKKEAKGSINNTKIEIDIQIFLHSINVNKKTIHNGKIHSARDSPSQVRLRALPLLFSKYLDIVVVAV